MNANELMIGDLLKWKEQPGFNDEDRNMVLRVKNIFDDAIKIDGRFELYHISLFEPIPLTPEILEKNGFGKVLDEDGTECYRYYNRAADGYIKISLYNGGDGDWGIEIVNYEKFDDNEIVYNNSFIFLTVHKLQHALRLCGIEKEIVL